MTTKMFDHKNNGKVRLGMFKLDSWVKCKTKKSDLKCKACKQLYSDVGKDIAGIQIPGKGVEPRCNDCGEGLIEAGWEDISIKINEIKNKKEELQKFILSNSSSWVLKGSYGGYRDLCDESTEQLEKIKVGIEQELEKERLIEEDIKNYVHTETEDYLSKDWDVYEDTVYLKSPLQIESHFKDIGHEYIECGQGFSQDEAEVLCKIGDKFYNVEITAEVVGAKQDVGDKLYWVESITSVTYKQVDKPLPKTRSGYVYVMTLSDEEKDKLDNYIKYQGLNCDDD